MSRRRIIIPKGLVNPTETTIIEIPAELSNETDLIAAVSTCAGSQSTPCSSPSRTPGGVSNSARPSARASRKSSNTFTKQPSFSRTQNICPGSPSFQIPQATSTPKSPSTLYDSSLLDSGSSIQMGTFGFGATQSISPRANNTFNVPPSLGRTHNVPQRGHNTFNVSHGFGETQNISPRANATYNAAPCLGTTRNIPTRANETFHVLPGCGATQNISSRANDTFNVHRANVTYNSHPNFGATQNICPGASSFANIGTPGNATYNAQPGYGEMISALNTPSYHIPQATSTPIHAGNVGETFQRTPYTYSSLYDSSIFDISPERTGTTTDESYMGRSKSSARSASKIIKKTSKTFIRTPVSAGGGGCPGNKTFNAQSGCGGLISPLNTPSYHIPQATSTPVHAGNVGETFQRTPYTYSSLYDSSIFDISPERTGTTTDESYYKSPARSSSRSMKNTSKTFLRSPSPMGSAGSIYSQSSLGLMPGGVNATYGCSGRRSKSEGRRPSSAGLGVLGNAYLNSQEVAGGNLQGTFTCPGSSTSGRRQSAPNSTFNKPKVVKRVSKTIIDSPPTCDGYRTRTIHETSTTEQEQDQDQEQEQNQSIVDGIHMELGEIEETERSQLEEDLKIYQEARRTLMANTTFTFGERSTNISSLAAGVSEQARCKSRSPSPSCR